MQIAYPEETARIEELYLILREFNEDIYPLGYQFARARIDEAWVILNDVSEMSEQPFDQITRNNFVDRLDEIDRRIVTMEEEFRRLQQHAVQRLFRREQRLPPIPRFQPRRHADLFVEEDDENDEEPVMNEVNVIPEPAVGEINVIPEPAVDEVNVIQEPAVEEVNVIQEPAAGKVNVTQEPSMEEVHIVQEPTLAAAPVVVAPVILNNDEQHINEPVVARVRRDVQMRPRRRRIVRVLRRNINSVGRNVGRRFQVRRSMFRRQGVWNCIRRIRRERR